MLNTQEKRRQELVLAAFHQIAERGFEGLRTREVAGEAGVNIANMAVSRTRRGDKALMVLSIDHPAPPELVERVHAEGFDDARFISLA